MTDGREENGQILDSNINSDLLKSSETEEFPPDPNQKPPIDAEILRETKTNFVEEIEPPAKELTGVAALLANLNTDEEVSVIVKRLKDGQFKGQFRIPCEIDGVVETVAWDGELYPDSIYRYVKKTYGGGRYRFQLRYGGGFHESWTEVLNDPSVESDAEKLLKKQETKNEEQPRTAPSSQQFAAPPTERSHPIKEAISELKYLKELQEIFTPPKSEPAPVIAPAVEPKITVEHLKMTLIERALNSPAHVDKAINAVFGIEPDKNPRPLGFWESIGASFASNPAIQEMLINGVSTVAAPLINLAMVKLMPPPAASPPPAPILRKPQINNQPPPQPTAPQTPANAPMPDQRTAAQPPAEQPKPATPALPLITLK